MLKSPLIWAVACCLILSGCPAEQTAEKAPENTAESAPAAVPVSGNAANGPQVFAAKGCVACHMISSLPNAKGNIGPALDGIGNKAATRVSGLDAEAYLRQSIEAPEAYLVEGYQNLMSKGLKDQMSEQEYNDLIAYLLSLKS
ncbi:MAG: c-type cytochrome [Candidatus Sericytochromatia bacterium]